jgi:dTDP-4-dehydrorhamnose reductase
MKTILVTGGAGLVGSAIKEISTEYPNYKFIFVRSKEYDLSS